MHNTLLHIELTYLLPVMVAVITGVLVWRQAFPAIVRPDDEEAYAGGSGKAIHDLRGMDRFLPLLSEAERRLVQVIAERTLEGGTTGLDAVNHLLGLAGKRPDLQKAYRSRVIGHINKAYRAFSGEGVDLLQRVRMEEDRRTYGFRIHSMELASALVDQSSSSK